MKIYQNIISGTQFQYEYQKNKENIQITLYTSLDSETKLGILYASICYKNYKQYYFDYIGHSRSNKTLALYGIILGLAKLKRSMPVIVYLDLSALEIKDIRDKDLYEQIESIGEQKKIPSLTLIGIQDGNTLLKEFSIEPKKEP